MATTLVSFDALLREAFSLERVQAVRPRPDLAYYQRRHRAWLTGRCWSRCRTLTGSQRRQLDALRAQLGSW